MTKFIIIGQTAYPPNSTSLNHLKFSKVLCITLGGDRNTFKNLLVYCLGPASQSLLFVTFRHLVFAMDIF